MPEPPGHRQPRLALLMGDVAGVGPEVVARVLETCCQSADPLVVGHPGVLARALDLVGLDRNVRTVDSPISIGGDPDPSGIDCWNPTTADVGDIPAATVDSRCGRAVADWLQSAAEAALEGHVDAMVTAPLNKTALAAAAGVLWFAEPLTAGLIVGTALTVAGLLMMENRRAQRRMEDGR